MDEGIAIRNDIREGDLQRILDLHSQVYREEYGYSDEFGEYVKGTLEEIERDLTERERFWFAEKKGALIGCIAVIERPDNTAQLRWFIVGSDHRRKGLGTFLFEEALSFIRRAGYERAYLTTQDVLKDAGSIYEKHGFVLKEESEVLYRWDTEGKEQMYVKRLD